MGRMEDQQWSITLGNTLLASIVCLLWYVFGLWEDKDKVGEESGTLTSAIEEKKVTRVDMEEVACTNGSTPGHLSSRPEEEKEEEQRLYMLPEQGRQSIIDQIKLRQEESAMQLKEEKTSVEEETKKRKTTSDVRKQTMSVFQWPQNAAVLETTLPKTSSSLSSDLEDKLKDLGIFRAGSDDDGISQVEGAARRCGLELTKKQVRLSFDTFMAKSRPGLESDEEVKESSPKPKKRQNNNNNNIKNKEHGEQQGADPNRWLEQPSLEDRATSTQSSSCEGVLVICLPLNMSKNVISALYM